MKAMQLNNIVKVDGASAPLEMVNLPVPTPNEGEILIRISACGVCHTELDEIEGRTPPASLPVVPGHQVVGFVEAIGSGVVGYKIGDRVGIAWIFSACGKCKFCLSGQENLCPEFKATGREANGGYAQYMTAPAAFTYLIPEGLEDSEAAPLLCAGAIGYRSLRLANLHAAHNLGLAGFGASGHLVLKLALHKYPDIKVSIFSRNPDERAFALELGASWAGGFDEIPPEKLEAIIDTTPVWMPVIAALYNLEAGGRLVINAIRKEEADKEHLQRIDYSTHLWREKEIKSVANVTRRDVSEFLQLAVNAGLKPEYQEYNLDGANQALLELKQGKIRGAKVLRIA